jgi:hypothetical protein
MILYQILLLHGEDMETNAVILEERLNVNIMKQSKIIEL